MLNVWKNPKPISYIGIILSQLPHLQIPEYRQYKKSSKRIPCYPFFNISFCTVVQAQLKTLIPER